MNMESTKIPPRATLGRGNPAHALFRMSRLCAQLCAEMLLGTEFGAIGKAEK